jgi:polyphosphate kinase 2 (PPK2 family)
VKERAFWGDYMDAYEDAINETATEKSPWYVIPADDKKNMRLIVSAAILHEMEKLDIRYPEMSPGQKNALEHCKKMLLAEK